jgi:hypothetical protein
VQLTHSIISGGEEKSAPGKNDPFSLGKHRKTLQYRRAKRAGKKVDPFFLQNRRAKRAGKKLGRCARIILGP